MDRNVMGKLPTELLFPLYIVDAKKKKNVCIALNLKIILPQYYTNNTQVGLKGNLQKGLY